MRYSGRKLNLDVIAADDDLWCGDHTQLLEGVWVLGIVDSAYEI